MLKYIIRPSQRGIEGKVRCYYVGHGGKNPETPWEMVSKGDRKKLEYDTVEEMTEHINEFEKNKGRAYEIKVLSVSDEAAMKPVKVAKTPKVKKSAKVEAKKSVKLPTKRSKKIATAPEAEVPSAEETDLASQIALALADESKVA